VGREDDSTACPEGTLPAAFGANSSYSVLTQLWGEKGIDERELAALIGAHTVSRAFAQQANGVPPASKSSLPPYQRSILTVLFEGSQDTTFTKWDNTYFRETQASNALSGVFRFDSDRNLAMANTTAGQAFTEFGNDFSNSITQDIMSAMY
jgi:manganese peroxidase